MSRTAGLAAAALLPAAATVWLAFHDGGYFPGTVALAATELALLLALRVALARLPWEGLSVQLALTLVLLGALAAWTFVSKDWSHSPARAMAEYDRVLLYLLTLAVFASLGFSARRARWMLYGTAAAIVAVCAAGFMARTLPQVVTYSTDVHPERLSYPLTYWNSLGLLAAVGIILCGHLACSTRDRWPARVLGAAAIPLLTATLYYTFSRGATWLALAGVLVYLVLGRPSGALSAAVASAPTALIALTTVNPAGVLTKDPMSDHAIAAGHRIALIVALCSVAAGALRAALLPLDRWAARVSLPERSRRPVLATAGAVSIALAVAGCAAVDAPGLVSEKYHEFSASDRHAPKSGASRFLNASSDARREHWAVANAVFRAHPLRGSGAGTWPLEWTQRRVSGLNAQDAHSLYLETRAELGMVGLVLLATVLLLMLGALLNRARGPNRAMFAAVFAAGLVWAVHAGIDWDWEMPAVTLWLFAFGGLALAAAPREHRPAARVAMPVRVAVVAVLALLVVLPIRMAVSEARMGDSLDALRAGDCTGAIADARAAISALRERPAPYQAIGFCELLRHRPEAASRAYRRAALRDPGNWELWHDLAVAQGRAGRDPRRSVNRAARLNPNNEDVRSLSAPVAPGPPTP
jgi:O-antigen ligase